MITDDDVKKLKESFSDTFATKDDLTSMEARQDKKYATKDDLTSMEARLDKKFASKDDLTSMEARQDKKFASKDDLIPIKESLRAINKKLDLTITYFDKETASHEPRLKAIESQLGITPVQN